MMKIRCVVERLTFQNPENGYSVLKVAVKGYSELVTVVGTMPDVVVGSVLLIDGDWKTDAKYGRQFVAQKWEETLPATVYGIEKYLGSGLIKGIGSHYAKKIVALFGEDTIKVIEETPDRLIEVSGIGHKRVERIKDSWEKQKDIKNVMLFLQGYDVSTAFASKIYKEYGKESIDRVTENPYRLADDIWGIGFKTADGIAGKMGFEKDCFARLRSGILFTLSTLADEGHVFAGKEQLIKKAAELLDVEEVDIFSALEKTIQASDVIAEDTAIYLPPFYFAEIGVANGLKKLLRVEPSVTIPESADLAQIEKETGITYDEIQKDAIRKALTSKVLILTGGPGTGKTTTTQGMIAAFAKYGLTILLAAPTGRAAKRMSEATGMEAKTIHRLLEFSPADGYKRNAETPLEGDVLILDEASMIDLILMNALVKAIPDTMRLIVVGDIDQLPSVGAGNVLRDMIASERLPVVRLTRIFRQAQSSRIIMNAHKINAGEYPNVSNGKNSDFFFIEEEDTDKAAAQIVELVQNRLPRAYRIFPLDIQVLTPMQRGTVGAANLNILLQNALNPTDSFLYRSGTAFRLNDKVMQIRNNYDKEVFNGDIGQITEVNQDNKTIAVRFDDRCIEYDITELDELVLAYATTVHKAQGSEYPVVVMPVLMSHFVMLERNLIYTGITRAKKLLVMIGSKKALGYAVGNVKVTERNSKLAERLRNETK